MNKKRILALLAALSISTCAVPVFAEEAAFPVEIEHAYGTTMIEEQPERVVTLFDSNSDAVLALGVARSAYQRLDMEMWKKTDCFRGQMRHLKSLE